MYSPSPLQVTNTPQDICYSSPITSLRRTTDNRQSSLPAIPPRSATLPSQSFDVIAKVHFWLENQASIWEPKEDLLVEPRVRSVTSTPPPSPISEKKSVHWMPEVEDNEGKTLRKFKPSPVITGRKRKASSFHPRHHPKVPEPPRGPPATPRPRRLPTPELPDLKHEEFCDCCSKGPINKMEAQLAAARSYIADAKQSAWRQIEEAAMTQKN